MVILQQNAQMQSSKINFKPSALSTQITSISSQISPFDKDLSTNNPFSDSFAKLTKSKLSKVDVDNQAKRDNLNPTSISISSSSTINSQFVFGQNLQDRVENAHQPFLSATSTDNGLNSHITFAPDSTVPEILDNGTNNLNEPTLFSLNKENSNLQSQNHDLEKDFLSDGSTVLRPVITSSDSSTSNLGIKESAQRHYENLQNAKRAEQDLNNSEVIISSGEEDEITVFQAYGKLYEFTSDDQVWIEKGSGYLKLNDLKDSSEGLKSRLIMRSQGNFRVILNSKVFVGTGADNPTKKSLRFLATESDSSSPRVYLFKGNANDVEVLTSALNSRVNEMTRQNTSLSPPHTSRAENRAGPSQAQTPCTISLSQARLLSAAGIGQSSSTTTPILPDGCNKAQSEGDEDDDDDGETTNVSSSGVGTSTSAKNTFSSGSKRKLADDEEDSSVASTSKKALNASTRDSEDSEAAYLDSSTDEEVALLACGPQTGDKVDTTSDPQMLEKVEGTVDSSTFHHSPSSKIQERE